MKRGQEGRRRTEGGEEQLDFINESHDCHM